MTEVILMTEFAPLQARITEFHITDATIYEAAEFRSELKAFREKAAASEKEIVSPLKKAYEDARAPYLALRKKIDEVESLLNKRLSEYAAAENERRRLIEQREREVQLAALKAAQEEAEKKADVEAVIALEEAQAHVETKPQENKLRSVEIGTAKVSFRDNWTYEITNASELPREYLCPDTAKINAAVKGGAREIPGLRIYNQPIPVGR
jgi:hypothetical protein